MRTLSSEITCVILTDDGLTGYQLGVRHINYIEQYFYLLPCHLFCSWYLSSIRKSFVSIFQVLLKHHLLLLFIVDNCYGNHIQVDTFSKYPLIVVVVRPSSKCFMPILRRVEPINPRPTWWVNYILFNHPEKCLVVLTKRLSGKPDLLHPLRLNNPDHRRNNPIADDVPEICLSCPHFLRE